MRHGWHFVVPFVVMVYTIFWLNMQAEEAALYSCLSLLVTTFGFGYRGQRPTLGAVVGAVRDTGIGVLDIIMICTGAGVVVGVLSVSGLAFGLTLALVSFAKQSLFLLLILAALASIVLGMGMPTVAVYVLLAALIAPAMTESGVLPMAAHMFVLYFGMMSVRDAPGRRGRVRCGEYRQGGPVADRLGIDALRLGRLYRPIPFRLFANVDHGWRLGANRRRFCHCGRWHLADDDGLRRLQHAVNRLDGASGLRGSWRPSARADGAAPRMRSTSTLQAHFSAQA